MEIALARDFGQIDCRFPSFCMSQVNHGAAKPQLMQKSEAEGLVHNQKHSAFSAPLRF